MQKVKLYNPFLNETAEPQIEDPYAQEDGIALFFN